MSDHNTTSINWITALQVACFHFHPQNVWNKHKCHLLKIENLYTSSLKHLKAETGIWLENMLEHVSEHSVQCKQRASHSFLSLRLSIVLHRHSLRLKAFCRNASPALRKITSEAHLDACHPGSRRLWSLGPEESQTALVPFGWAVVLHELFTPKQRSTCPSCVPARMVKTCENSKPRLWTH